MKPSALALAEGELNPVARLTEASNLALLAHVTTPEGPLQCIYKPSAGERPLWDFPGATLAAREVLTAQVADCFGWDLVPLTVWRSEGPAGPGMCQEWVESVDDPPVQLFPVRQVPAEWSVVATGLDAAGQPVALAHDRGDWMQRLVLLDALVNNADRKGGHVLRRGDGTLAAIDHGVTFHSENKLRTVLWGWAGAAIPPPLLDELRQGAAAFGDLVRHWGQPDSELAGASQLSAIEVDAAIGRLDRLLAAATFPLPAEDWPALPWPPL